MDLKIGDFVFNDMQGIGIITSYNKNLDLYSICYFRTTKPMQYPSVTVKIFREWFLNNHNGLISIQERFANNVS